ncbi:MAG TPA: hypothetical protein PLL78_11520 [Fimbriimonadaceae bacterium]|nr:hypothetical protein [Fimbriimonadaceae bacterium]HRJ97304.1 hypothetical protein [Fimbriimonadaceae bacterium]
MKTLAFGLVLVSVSCFVIGIRSVEEANPGFRSEEVPTAVLAIRQRWQSRLSKDGTVPEGALTRALAQRGALLAGEERGSTDFSPWTWLGPANIGGRIRSVVIDPNNPNTMYTGAMAGGVWKTTDGGANWFPLDGFMPAIGVCSLVMHPTNANVIYAGTGEGFFESVEGSQNTAAIRGAGIFKTTDAGVTWNQIPTTNTPDWYFVNRIDFQPGNPSVMLAATNSGIWRSTNGGDNWTQVWTGHAYDIDFNPNNASQVVAGVHDNPGVVYSSNAGLTFSNSTGMSNVHRAEVKWAANTASTCYALVSAMNQTASIYRSTNSGQTWTLRSAPSIPTYEAYNIALWVDPTNSNFLVYGAVNLFRSTDGGNTRTNAFPNIHADHHDIIHHPGYNGGTNRRLFFAGDGGVGFTNDATTGSGGHMNNGLGITQFYGAAYSPSGKIIGGAQDNYTNIYSGSVNWQVQAIGGDGGFAAADSTDANFLYGSSQVLGIRRSSNNGGSFSSITSGLTDAGSTATCNFIPHYILDPNNPNTMLACGLNLWRNSNVKGTPAWTIIKTPTTDDPPEEWKKNTSHMNVYDRRHHSTVTVAQGNSNLIWVGHNNGKIFKTTNGTAGSPTWTRVDTNIPGGGPGRWVAKIVIDPADHQRVFVAFLGWDDDNIWLTLDGGTTWSQATGMPSRRIPTAPVGALAMDPLRPNRIFAGTDIGLFISHDSGQSWGAVTDGPDTCPIDELVWKDSDELINVTHGRGLYIVNVTPTATQVQPSALSIGGLNGGGNLASLLASDNARLRVIGLFQKGGPQSLHVEVTSTAPYTNPLSIRLTVESQATAGQNQAVRLWNYDSGAYETVDTRAVTETDATIDIDPTGSASRFVNPLTREIRARIVFLPLVMSKPIPTASVDFAGWTFQK